MDFFGRKANEKSEYILKRYNEIKKKQNKLERNLKESQSLFEKMIEISQEDNVEFLEFSYNDKADEYVVIYRAKEKYDIYILTPSSLRSNKFLPTLFNFYAHKDYRNQIEIMDIQNFKHINQGFGSIAMKNLIKIAKKEKVLKIYGNLSPVDHDHRNRQEHFYKKHGFIIKGNSISLQL